MYMRPAASTAIDERNVGLRLALLQMRVSSPPRRKCMRHLGDCEKPATWPAPPPCTWRC